ncbi:restriction endonuclease subunit S [Acaryochloris sp. IP29b_bin.137]|uniref:restriction endonuclease subunit S n=1 Tax=Acaryochloris sp. IP29b_bin.137 TaxID=2969217 RepID=UPI00260DCEA8|nr:restriction endonuclease subunit S [Acaryochloris sp. IP29b_bin.137]
MLSEQHGLYPRGFSSDTNWIWPLVPAKDLVTLNYGKALRESDRNSGDTPVYGTNGRCGWHDSSLTKGPGVILGRKGQGPLGVEWCDKDFWVIDTAYFVTANRSDLDLRYFYYLVNYIGLNHLKVGTSNPSLSRDTFDLQLLPFPPFETQKEIVRILATLDRKIDTLRKQNDTLEKIAQTLFKHWFVDFEFPFDFAQGKPSTDGKPYKSSGGAMVPSELGEIPAGWHFGDFDDFFNLFSGGTPKTSIPEYWDGDVKWLSGKDVTSHNKNFILHTEKQISELGLQKSAAKLLPQYTTVISARGTVGNYCLLSESMAISQSNFGVLAQKKEHIFFGHLLIGNLIDKLKREAYGSVFDTITTSNFKRLKILIPDLFTLTTLEKNAVNLFEKILVNSQQIQTLTNVRDTLLPKLMSGKLRVGDSQNE